MEDFILFFLIGIIAQAVDGALGMAYGVISSTVLLSFGVPPAHASAAVHAAEMFTTAASGTAHLYHRNINWKLFFWLAPFGIIGGVLGAYVLTSFEGDQIKPFITVYLAVVGLWLLFRSFRKIPRNPVRTVFAAPLGLVGGFLDAAGGGGWGPIVTTGLLGAGGPPRYVIGTVNSCEFLITLSVSLSFLISLLTGHWESGDTLGSYLPSIAGLVAGGLIAAPFAGWVVKRLSEKHLLRAVALLIITLATHQALKAFGVL